MKRYNPKDIEQKWQAKWEADGIYRASEDPSKPKRYVLEYFPYPSGAAMHVGHVRNYTIGDAVARFHRMQGENVLHPMGWDAFGLPAENYAIKTGISPRQAIDDNTGKFKQQLMQMGFSYDWSREIDSTDPKYYRWTQWFFLMLFKKGLAYQQESLQWWCPVDKTVLANEQVEAGRCWRCGNEVEKKALKQWFFKITDYADRLLEDLDDLNWSDAIKSMQRNWIGRSQGAEVDFKLVSDSNYVLLHGYTGRSDAYFFPWLSHALTNHGSEVYAPDLPNTDKPDADEQAAYVLKNTGFDENTVLLGHSYGSVTALKILEKLDHPIKKLVLVAGFAEPGFLDRERNFESATNWKFDFDKIKANVDEIVILRAKNDSAVPPERAEFLQAKLGGTIADFTAEDDHVCGKVEPVVGRYLQGTITVFTTRPDTLFGATFMVLAPEHPLVKTITTDEQRAATEAYVKQAQAKSDIERQETDREKTGVFTGAYAINPVNDEKIPIWVADYVLSGYGTGAIMAVPAHDERDHAFAQKFDLPIRYVINPASVRADAEDQTDFKQKKKVVAIVENDKGEILTINWGPKLGGRLTIGGTIEAGEAPETTALREVTEETGYSDLEVIETGQETYDYKYFAFSKQEAHHVAATFVHLKLKSDARQAQQLDQSEMDNFTVEWVDQQQADREIVEPLHRYGFEKFILGHCFHGEGLMTNSGPYDGLSSSEAREKIVADLAKTGVGQEVTNYKMRDWLISRQRYWGAPIPIIHCPKDGAVAVPDDQLPVVLPELKNFEPSGDGRSPLANVKDFVQTICPKCGGPAERETDTMDGFACSSWYFLRFADPHNDEQPFARDKADFWLPVDDYIGGAEHAVMHLLYARFWTKVMFDDGLINFEEPFSTLRNQGMILAPDGQKMSKSKGNTIMPEELIDQGYGADSIRVMELFIGPWNQSANWSVEGMGGSFRFLQRVWTLTQEHLASVPSPQSPVPSQTSKDLQHVLHATTKKVTEDLRDLAFNTAVSSLMECTNEFYKLKTVMPLGNDYWQTALEILVKLMAPFAPHIAEELWQQLGHDDSIHTSTWPTWDENLLVKVNMIIAVQVNGKVRGEVEVPANATEKQVISAAKKHEKVAGYLSGHDLKKTVYVPGKLVSFVI